MSLEIRLSGTTDDSLKSDLDRRAAANRQALTDRTTDKQTAAQAETQLQTRVLQTPAQQTKRPTGGLPLPVFDEQTADVRKQAGFQFYYTFYSFFNIPAAPTGAARLKTSYDTLVQNYGDGWPTGVIEVNSLAPYLQSAGVQYDTPYNPVYNSTPFLTLSRLSAPNTLLYPEMLSKPFTDLQIKQVSAPTVGYTQVTPSSSSVSLTGNFFGSLSRGYTAKNNVMFAVSPDLWWNVPGWPAPLLVPPPDGPLWTGDGFTPRPSTSSSGGNSEKFPASYTPVTTATLTFVTQSAEIQHTLFYSRCDAGSSDACEYLCLFLDLSVVVPTCGYFRRLYRGAVTNAIYTEPGTETLSETVPGPYVGPSADPVYFLPPAPSTVPQPQPAALTFRPSLLQTALEASNTGLVVAYLLNDAGVLTGPAPGLLFDGSTAYKYVSGRDADATNLITEAMTLGITILDFRTPIGSPVSEPQRALYFEWVNAQYAVAKRIESLVANPQQTFFGLLSHEMSTWNGGNPVSAFTATTTPYSSLTTALNFLRARTLDSFNPNANTAVFSAIDFYITGAPFTVDTRDKLKELVVIRQKTARAMVAQYLGQATVVAIENGNINTPEGRGKLQV